MSDISKLLNAVSSHLFVEYYWEFKDSKKNSPEIRAILPREYTEKSRISRTSKARKIFRENLHIQTLEEIIKSKRLQKSNPKIIEMAKDIYSKETQNQPPKKLVECFNNIKNLDDLYKYIEKIDYVDKDYHISNDLVKIRDYFSEIKDEESAKKLQCEIDFYNISANCGNLKHHMSFINDKGEEIIYPDMKKFTNYTYDYLKERQKNCDNLLFKAKYAHILWKTQNEFESVKIAIDAYINLSEFFKKLESESPGNFNGMKSLNALENAFYLSLETGKTAYKLATITKKIKEDIADFNPKSSSFFKVRIDLIKIMVNYKKYFNLSDFIGLEDICLNMADEFKGQSFTFGFLELGEKIDRILKKKTHPWLNKKAEYYEILMNENALFGSEYCLQAIDIYKKLKDQIKIDELEQKYNELIKNVELQQFKSDPIDITDAIKHYKEIAKKLETEDLIKYLLGSSSILPNIESIKSTADSISKETPFLSICSAKELDARGHTKKHYTDEQEKQKQGILQVYDFNMQLQSRLIIELFIQSVIERKLTYENLINYLLNKSWVGKRLHKPLPNKQTIEYSWLDYVEPAIRDYFNEINYYLLNPEFNRPNFTLSIDSLIIKIEGMIRELFELHKFPTYKMNRDKNKRIITGEENINKYLWEEENIGKILSEDEIWYFRWLLVESENLRNKVAHCLIYPVEYNFTNMHLILLAFLRLCKFNLTIKESN